MVIKDAMQPVTSVPYEMTITEVSRFMDAKVLSSVLVEENNELIGIMTERDILRKVVAMGRNPAETTVKDVMNAPLITVDANTYIEDAADLLREKDIRRLVVTENDRIVGVVGAKDLTDKTRFFIAKRLRKGASYSGKS